MRAPAATRSWRWPSRWACARRCPIRPRCRSAPIEVTVLDHAGAFASFPNGGLAVTPHAALEVRSADGRVIWRADRDLPKPRRVFPQQVAADMNMMLNKAVEEGTGRRTILPGIKSSGKTGTTNAYRDAWFNGYTGNMTAAIWVGNDDYAPDQPHDRRLAARHDLAADHGLCASGRRDQTLSGRRARRQAPESPPPRRRPRPPRPPITCRRRICSRAKAPTSWCASRSMMEDAAKALGARDAVGLARTRSQRRPPRAKARLAARSRPAPAPRAARN